MLQVALCGVLLTGVGILLGFSPIVAFVAGMGFVLTSTAIVMQILTERGELATPAGPEDRLDPAARGPRDRAAAGGGRAAVADDWRCRRGDAGLAQSS